MPPSQIESLIDPRLIFQSGGSWIVNLGPRLTIQDPDWRQSRTQIGNQGSIWDPPDCLPDWILDWSQIDFSIWGPIPDLSYLLLSNSLNSNQKFGSAVALRFMTIFQADHQTTEHKIRTVDKVKYHLGVACFQNTKLQQFGTLFQFAKPWLTFAATVGTYHWSKI